MGLKEAGVAVVKARNALKQAINECGSAGCSELCKAAERYLESVDDYHCALDGHK